MKQVSSASTGCNSHNEMDYDDSLGDTSDMDEDLSFRTLDSMNIHRIITRKPKHPSIIVGHGFSFHKTTPSEELNDECIQSWHSTTASCSDASSGTYYSVSEIEDSDGIGAFSFATSIAAQSMASNSSFFVAMTSSENAEHDKCKIDHFSHSNGCIDDSSTVSPNRQALNVNISSGRFGRISPRKTLRFDTKVTTHEAPILKPVPDLSCVYSFGSSNMTAFPGFAFASAVDKELDGDSTHGMH
jgi:hypothetical protein